MLTRTCTHNHTGNILTNNSDKTAEEQKGYVAKMPWLAIPYASRNRAIVPRLLGITGLPTLLFFDENNKVSASGSNFNFLNFNSSLFTQVFLEVHVQYSGISRV
jgi:Thioredoxin-like